MLYRACSVIAEIGCVHAGSLDRAKDLVRLATLAGADYCKFQKRNPHESVPKEIRDKPHPNALFSYGKTYLDHRIALEFTLEQHISLKQYCETIGTKYACSVWDLTSAKDIVSLKPDFIKIPSPCNLNFTLLRFLTENYGGDLHISLGMIDNLEKQKLFNEIQDLNIGSRTVLYHCTSEYPCPFERLYLEEIVKLRSLTWPKAIGFSNHGYGISADIISYTLGAEWIERHFVDDRTFRHSDAAASLEPDGLRRVVRDLKAARLSLKAKERLSEVELAQRRKLQNHD